MSRIKSVMWIGFDIQMNRIESVIRIVGLDPKSESVEIRELVIRLFGLNIFNPVCGLIKLLLSSNTNPLSPSKTPKKNCWSVLSGVRMYANEVMSSMYVWSALVYVAGDALVGTDGGNRLDAPSTMSKKKMARQRNVVFRRWWTLKMEQP